MELDELKESWRKSNEDLKVADKDILQLIKSESAGPVAILKRRFKKGLIIIPFITGIAIVRLSAKEGIMANVLTWYLVLFTAIMMLYFYLNYRLMQRMQQVSGNVKENLLKQVSMLKLALKWRLLIMRGFIIAIFVFTEAVMYFKADTKLESWEGKPLWFRFAVYACVIIFFYFLTKFATRYRYKNHILHLQALIEQMK